MDGYGYTCGVCRNIQAIEGLEQAAEELEHTMEAGIAALRETVDSGLAQIASVLEWGFGEMRWQLQQQTNLLSSIDKTLQTPSETKANEWRLHAEQLRQRGSLEDAEEFFLKALNEYRLDYRIYVGLAETYLKMNNFDKAKLYLQKSLPHAPSKEIDYKSYSYRLIGRIQFCEEDFHGAVESLHLAISLSPDYPDALYDFAQYSCLLSDQDVDYITSETFRKWGGNWAQRNYDVIRILCLQKAIKAKPLYFYLVERERNFDSHRNSIRSALTNLLDNARGRVENTIGDIERIVPEVESSIWDARRALAKSNETETLKSVALFEDAKAKLKLAKQKLASNDYLALLDAQPLAEEALQISNKARNLASQEALRFRKIRSQKVSRAWSRVPAVILIWPLIFALLGGIATEFLGGLYHAAINQGNLYSWNYFLTGFYVGVPAGFLYGIYDITKSLK
jgi:tetratricopeptide (TPR) repeat protein